MSGSVLAVNFFGLALAITGFVMAFRQGLVRHLLCFPTHCEAKQHGDDSEGDPLAYILRISGVMVMVFGIAIAGMVNLFSAAQT